MRDDELDLRPIVLRIVRRWRMIVSVALLAALTTTSVVVMLPRQYVATAAVLLRPTASELALDPRYVTTETTDQPSYRQSLVAIATSDGVESRIPPDVLRQLDMPDAGCLCERIVVTATGNLLTIAATGPSAAAAKLLADSWTAAFVAYANEAFGGSATAPDMAAAPLRDARASLDAAQHAYEQQLAHSPVEELDHEIAAISDTLAVARQADHDRFGAYLSRIQQADQLADDVAALRADMASGRAIGLADQLTSLALRARAANSATLPIQLEVADPELLDSAEDVSPERLDAFALQLRRQRVELQRAAVALADALAGDSVEADTTLTAAQRAAYFARLRDLQRSREAERARNQRLAQERDIALETLQVAQRKLAEQQVAATSGDAQARVANLALLPRKPASRQIVLKSASGLLAGALVGMALALVSSVPHSGPDGQRPRRGLKHSTRTSNSELAAS